MSPGALGISKRLSVHTPTTMLIDWARLHGQMPFGEWMIHVSATWLFPEAEVDQVNMSELHVNAAAPHFNCPCNGLIDKCCEQDRVGRGGTKVCTAPLAGADLREACGGTADYSTCFSNPSPSGRNL